MEDNKYAIDDEKKILRRKRRVRNRILAWVFLLIFVLVIGACGFLAYKHFVLDAIVESPSVNTGTSTSTDAGSGSEDNNSEHIGSAIDELLGGEDDVVVSVPTEEDLAPTEEELFDAAVTAYVESMPVEQKVAGMFIVYPEQITGVATVIQAGDGTKKALLDNPVGGLVYRPQNIKSKEQFATMLANTRDFAVRPLFLAVNEELGNTVISSKLNLYKSDMQTVIGTTGNEENAYSEASQVADYLTEFGINVNLGIIAEVTAGWEGSVLDGRTFSDDPDVVSKMLERTVAAYNEKHISSALEYFPGQSFATQDTTVGIANSTRTKTDLFTNELKTFSAGVKAGADFIVVSHVTMPSLMPEEELIQSSMSKAVMTGLIRDEMQLDDVIIITDFMDKAAISNYYESSEAAVKAIRAGADMVMCPANYQEAYEAVLKAVGNNVISEKRVNDALVRIYKVKFRGMTAEEVEKLINTSEEAN